MKKVILAAVLSVGAATLAQAGSNPVTPGVPVTITTSITIPTITSEVGTPAGGGIPVFFIVTPPTSPGGFFTFRLVANPS